MSPEKQRIAIAEACGFERHGGGDYWASLNGELAGYLDGEIRVLPDYLNDLNAIHKAEGKLTLGQASQYLQHLCAILPAAEWNKIAHLRATAAQRAEAFLKTLNLWEDDNS